MLDRIELKHDSSVDRQTQLTHGADAGTNSRLRTLQECGASTAYCLATTTLNWGTATSGHGSAVSGPTTGSVSRPLDLNGDGYEDLFWAVGSTWTYALAGAAGHGAAVN